ncbi:MAG: bifunctional oligoribonuclease/PAP phosphatase NrnA [Defluviitaleaceae bacterium]|nr:bifunctional oligoribonuclease/PAP phosphatase NrnA [Defluviitaleaceae bacterium]MCL2240570.1 bifunctional oligoribonuclease/PAP phosphatase NrnA [Defluviitaleaceae bacterium]
MSPTDAIRAVLRNHQRFVISGHVNPDGDAIGSCMGLALALAKMGKEPIVVLEDFPKKFRIVPGEDFIWKKPHDELTAEVFVALDCADVKRLGTAKALFDRMPVTVCVDHHGTNDGFAQYNLIDPDASSTSEMVYNLFAPLVDIDPDIATAIYAGMVTDTGGFRYQATCETTLSNAIRMIETGIPFTEIYNELMHRHSFLSSKALGVVIANAKQALKGRIVYSSVTRQDLAAVGATPNNLDRTAEYLMCTRGAEVALFVYERETAPEVKISLRSHHFHVGRFAARWGGGGHQLAAGCTVVTPLEEILPILLEELEKEL